MKFGKRQPKEPDAGSGAPAPVEEPVAAVTDPVAEPADAPIAPPDSPFAESWTQPAPAAPEAESLGEPAAPETHDVLTETEPPAAPAGSAVPDEPIVEGEAFELFTDDPPAPDPALPPPSLPIHRHEPPPPGPAPVPFPAAEQPVAVNAPGAAAPVTALGDAGEAFASGHGAAPGSGSARPAPSWQEPVKELAGERPELVVGAAFAGGLLFAMILRRLGH